MVSEENTVLSEEIVSDVAIALPWIRARGCRSSEWDIGWYVDKINLSDLSIDIKAWNRLFLRCAETCTFQAIKIIII